MAPPRTPLGGPIRILNRRVPLGDLNIAIRDFAIRVLRFRASDSGFCDSGFWVFGGFCDSGSLRLGFCDSGFCDSGVCDFKFPRVGVCE
eukprot:15437635-Alexandrium_andersonii.AAC.1